MKKHERLNKIKLAIKVFAFACALSLAASSATAANKTHPKVVSRSHLTNYFEEKITQVQDSLQTNPGPEYDPKIALTDINIDITGLVSYGLSDVLKLSLSAEIDFVIVPDEP